MSFKPLRIISSLYIVFAIVSCVNKSIYRENTINVASSLSIKNKELNKPLNVQKIIPLQFTNASMLGENVIIVDISDEFIVVKDSKIVYIFDSKGNYLSKIDCRGQGYREYLNISDILVDVQEENVLILDFFRNSVKKYNFKGNFISEIKDIQVMSFERVNNDCIIGFNPPFSDYEFTFISDNWRKRDSIHKRKSKFTSEDFTVFKDFKLFDSHPYFYDNSSGVVNFFNQKNIDTLLIVDKGEFQIPSEIAYSLKRKKERRKYIWGDYINLTKDFLFLEFYYKNEKYYDIWDINTKKLLFRKSINSPNQSIHLISTDNQVIEGMNVWVKFIKNDKLYFLVEPECINLDNKGNPIILQIDVKSLRSIL